MELIQTLVVMWVGVALLALINLYVWQHPVTIEWVRWAIVGAAASTALLLTGFVGVSLYHYENARYGMGLALIIFGVLASIWYAFGRGWRPSMPKGLHWSVPFRAVWPQARYTRRYTYTVEDIKE